ncbi:DUF2474 family protein [Duganella sp. FT92W]|uniref:DUF2474 family protein n=1 Tax=Pseudoduganella rivuli TaxID=2666085 RepID=A0A7X2LXV1_9BURK|nr:DUF2474 domain-containing protein [Pseudoduganella rivuli]MRV76319.1 DUF2474 family protein [Pseudoduganella rivuli]
MRALWLKRLGWLVLIWCASVGALGLAALLMRWLMNAAGLNR